MRRLSLLVVGGAVLILVGRVSAPAEPVAGLPMLSVAEAERAEQATQSMAPVARQIDQEAERLRQHLAQRVPFAEPARDPFRFMTRATPKTAAPKPSFAAQGAAEAGESVVLNVPKPPAILVPTLIALTSDDVDGAVVHAAVLSMNDELAIVKVGQAFDRFQIKSITADTIELLDVTSSTRTVTTLTIK